MMPDHEDHHDPDLAPGTASAMQKIVSTLGLVVGVLFLVAFVYLRMAEGDAHLWLLLAGLFFLLAPVLAKRFLH